MKQWLVVAATLLGALTMNTCTGNACDSAHFLVRGERGDPAFHVDVNSNFDLGTRFQLYIAFEKNVALRITEGRRVARRNVIPRSGFIKVTAGVKIPLFN